MRNREFVFTPKIEYQLVAESANSADKLREADQNSLTFPFWCTCEESNLNYKIRNLVSYPLNDRCPTSPRLRRASPNQHRLNF